MEPFTDLLIHIKVKSNSGSDVVVIIQAQWWKIFKCKSQNYRLFLVLFVSLRLKRYKNTIFYCRFHKCTKAAINMSATANEL